MKNSNILKPLLFLVLFAPLTHTMEETNETDNADLDRTREIILKRILRKKKQESPKTKPGPIITIHTENQSVEQDFGICEQEKCTIF